MPLIDRMLSKKSPESYPGAMSNSGVESSERPDSTPGGLVGKLNRNAEPSTAISNMLRKPPTAA